MIKNILVVRNDRFGEFLLNIPALRALKETYPQARISLAVSSMVCELAGLVDCVDDVVVWDEVRKDLRKHKFDLAVVLNPTKEAHWAVFWAGIPQRAGYDRKWGFLLTHKLKDTKHLGNRHEIDCNLELVGLIGVRGQSPSGTVPFDKTIKIKVDDSLLRNRGQSPAGISPAGTVPDVAIHLFTSDPVKQWPIERFGELAQRIKRELGLKVVMVGRVEDGDRNIGDRPLRGLSPIALRGLSPSTGTVPDSADSDGIVDMINKTSLVELAVLLKRCSLLVSGDSGPMHLAAAVGTPVIALFRNDLSGKTAKRWGPWGSGHIVIERGNLLDISVDEIFDIIRNKLRGQAPSGTVPLT